MTRRASARVRREQQRQRLVVTIVGGILGVALLALLVGVLYDRVWLPSRPVATVNNATLTRGEYEVQRRYQLARNISNNLQLQAILGSQYSSQFGGQTSSLDAQAKTIATDPVDDQTVSDWIDRQLITAGGSGLGVQVDDGKVAQALVRDLRTSFPDPTPITSTMSTTATAALSETTATATTEAAAATETAASTAAPTSTPQPTLEPNAALGEQEKIVGRVFDAYVSAIASTDPSRRAALTIDDFRQGLIEQYRRQTLVEAIQTKLVSAEDFTPTTDPASVVTRQIFLAVTVPVSATEQEKTSAFAARKTEIDALYKQLQGGADFVTLAKATTEDYNARANDGEAPSFDKDGKTQEGTQVDPAYVQAALALEPGKYSQPVQTPFGWHIIQLVSKDATSTEEQLRTARTDAFDAWLKEQRAAATIQRFPAQTPTAEVPTGTAAPLPTAPLGGLPTDVPTAGPVTSTGELTGTNALTDTVATETAPAAAPSPAATTESATTATSSPAATTEASATATP